MKRKTVFWCRSFALRFTHKLLVYWKEKDEKLLIIELEKRNCAGILLLIFLLCTRNKNLVYCGFATNSLRSPSSKSDKIPSPYASLRSLILLLSSLSFAFLTRFYEARGMLDSVWHEKIILT